MARLIPEVFDDLEVGITLHNPETGKIIGVNERLTELYGYTAAELREMDVPDYTAGDFTQVAAEQRIRAAADGEPQTFEWQVRRANDERVWVGVRLARTTLEGDPYVIAEIRDISDQKEREQNRRDERAFIDGVIEALPDVFYAFDEFGQFYAWNDVLCEVTGYTDDEIAEMTPLDFFPEQERGRVESVIATIIETEQPQRIESEYLTRDGRQIPYEFSGGPLYDSERNLNGIAGMGRNIDERKKYETKLERSNHRLQEFASILSHDLQEPLRMVSSYVNLLEEEVAADLDEETREYMDFAADGAERMQAMIDGLLAYSRVESRGGEFEATDIGAVIENVRQDLALVLEEADAELRAQSLSTVQADPQQVAQVFRNLVKNAVEHGGDGTRIEIDAVEQADGYEFAVADDGPGIPADQRDDVFGLFDKGTDSDGTGIGLAVCERIIVRHDGSIWVEPTSSGGTTVKFTLPAR